MKIKLDKDAIMPTRATDEAAGYDLYANLNRTVRIYPGKTEIIHTGVYAEIPKNTFGGIFARSGLATKQGLRPANCVGVIDSDYRGEICVALHNDSDLPKIVGHGDRIAQLVIIPYVAPELELTDSLDETDRGAGGFGSTGK